ncbi:MAG: lamin tail domain-containing protein [Candidatus Nitrosopelagicus sp.]|nr:lamin tail domain-containing protein [Candidatus Nitrosopelagicus sp.]
MKNPILFGLMAILLLGGTITPALSQTSPNSVVINEVEINTQNGSEFVELYNPTTQPIDLSGWSITPSASWKNYKILPNTVIEPQSFLSFTHHPYWFIDFGDTISLTNNSGELIDKTPLLIDKNNDGETWQRSTDGLDTDSMSDWKLERMTPNSSNGKITETEETIFSFTGQTDKSNYVFGDTLTIYGNVSESLFEEKHQSTPEIIKIHVKGPDYSTDIELYPDRNLSFSTTLHMQKVLGFALGNYEVDISYGNNSIQTGFILSEPLNDASLENASSDLEIFSNKESYIPGETAIIFAKTNSSIEYGGLDYVILDPNGKIYSSGAIFPNSKFSVVHQSGGGQIYPFSTQILLHGVNPVYGTYQIQGTFKAQDPIYRSSGVEISTSATFELVEDVKENTVFSLSLDKEVYSIHDTIIVTGRSNQVWTENIALIVQQTGVLSRSADAMKDQYVRPDPFTLNESVMLNGDGTFEFEFKIVNNLHDKDDANRYFGDYRLTVSEYFGHASLDFKVVENPESFVDIRTPLGLQMDNSQYVLGTAFSVTGKVLGYDHKASNNAQNYVEITIKDPSGKFLMSEDRRANSDIKYESTAPNEKLTFTAIPDVIGNFQLSAILHPIQFDFGTYTLVVNHPNLKIIETVEFKIISAQSEILEPEDTQEPLIFELCSSTKADISDIIKDMTAIGKDEIPPAMKYVVCDNATDFKTGEKLVIKGKVKPKEIRSLDQSSVKTSGQTQGGSSYSTNFAQAEMNYVEVSIPYPQTITISSSYRTTPSDGEEYHGGGGSGAGGVTVGDGSQGIGGGGGGSDSGRETNSQGSTGYNADVVYQTLKKNLIDMKVKAYPDKDGNFITVFDLRPGIFVDGIYKIKAKYFGYKSEQNFLIVDNSLKGGLKPELLVDVNKIEYIPGETVSISGKIKNVYYYDSVSLKIEPPNISKINCLQGQQCGFGNTEKKLRVTEGTEGAEFFMNYKIPFTDAAVGKYTVIADTHFGQIEKPFFVINESDILEQTSPIPGSSSESTPMDISKKIIEKFNRIADDKIPIILTEKSSDDSTLTPRVIQGSLFTSARGEESDVNLRITTDGQCVIGTSSDCLVTESTRKPGAIYSIVTIDDVNYKIRYSGNDVRLEKFSIVPENSNSKIDIDNWNVEIIKEEQPSRFYYKVSYVALE